MTVRDALAFFAAIFLGFHVHLLIPALEKRVCLPFHTPPTIVCIEQPRVMTLILQIITFAIFQLHFGRGILAIVVIPSRQFDVKFNFPSCAYTVFIVPSVLPEPLLRKAAVPNSTAVVIIPIRSPPDILSLGHPLAPLASVQRRQIIVVVVVVVIVRDDVAIRLFPLESESPPARLHDPSVHREPEADAGVRTCFVEAGQGRAEEGCEGEPSC
mmetsp:Transcript_641/g.1482  ORF Transcript_641/g.1482 Transcript_641/m.1482 type:complete len:213 (+) Transcript_641:1158-1796(+)